MRNSESAIANSLSSDGDAVGYPVTSSICAAAIAIHKLSGQVVDQRAASIRIKSTTQTAI